MSEGSEVQLPDLRDLRLPVVPRWAVIAIVVAIALIVTLTLNALKESGTFDGTAASSSDGATGGSSRGQVIEPIEPMDPEDKGAGELGKANDREKSVDPSNPFSTGFGTSGRRKVTVRVSGDGVVNMEVQYRDGQQTTRRAVNGAYSATRTFKGRYPMAAVAIQIPGNIPGSATRATCTIVVDGVEVARKTTNEPGAVTVCTG